MSTSNLERPLLSNVTKEEFEDDTNNVKDPPILLSEDSKNMKRSARASMHLVSNESSNNVLRTYLTSDSLKMMGPKKKSDHHLENREKRNNWVKDQITRAFRQEKSPLSHYVYMRRRLYLARLCFALASASLYVSQNLIQFSKEHGGATGERVYEQSVLFGTAFGAVLYGLRLDRMGWFRTTLEAASMLTIGTFLGLAFRVGLSATTWGVSDQVFDIIYSICLFFAGILTGFGIGGFYPIAATLNTSLKRSCGEEVTKGLDQSLSKTFTMQWVGRFTSIVVSILLYGLILRGSDDDVGIVSDTVKLVHDSIISVLLILAMLYVVYHTFKLRKESGAKYFINEEEDHLNHTLLDWETIRCSLSRHRHVLIGMSISWFVFDFIYYGNIGVKDVLTRAYQHENNSTYIDKENSIWIQSSNQLFILLISVAGYVLGIQLMGIQRLDRSMIQSVMFGVVALLYIVSIPLCSYNDVNTSEFFVQFVMTLIRFVVLDAGPNTTTFVCSAALASPTTPGLLFGLAAGAGKLGASLGYFILQIALNIKVENYIQADARVNLYVLSTVLCVIASVVTFFFVTKRPNATHQRRWKHLSSRKYESVELDSSMNSVHTPDIFIPLSELDILYVFMLERENISFSLSLSYRHAQLITHQPITHRYDKPIGQGGDGVVFRALRDDVDVMVKVVRRFGESESFDSKPSKTKSWHADGDLVDEMHHLLRLRHSHINRIYGFCETPHNTLGIVCDYQKGGSLEKLLESRSHVDLRYWVKWARQISVAMNYLHTRTNPVIHLDMKCANVLLDNVDHTCASVKIIDFGRAQTLSPWNQHLKHACVSTPAYAAPELLTNAGVDLLAKPLDVYSTGVMFGYMFSGVKPWKDEKSIFSIYEKVKQGFKPPIGGGVRDVPDWLNRFVLSPMLFRGAEMRPKFVEISNRIRLFEEKRYGTRRSFASISTEQEEEISTKDDGSDNEEDISTSFVDSDDDAYVIPVDDSD